MHLFRTLLFFGVVTAASAADVVTVDATGAVTITGTAPAVPAANEVRIGAGQIRTGGAIVANDVTIVRTAPATKNQLVRGDDPAVAKAWVNFNGTNGQIRSSMNVTSVVRNSAGNYTINFTSAFSSLNFIATGSAGDDNAYATLTYEMGTAGQYRTPGSVRIYTIGLSGGVGTPRDATNINWIFYGN